MQLDDLTYEKFAKLTGQRVLLSSDDHGDVSLELVAVERAKGERPDNAFSVLFKGPRQPHLQQMMYQIDLGPSGSHPIFLVPIIEEADGYIYEAVFTRLEDS